MKSASHAVSVRPALTLLLFAFFVGLAFWLIFQASLPRYWELALSLIAAPAGWALLRFGSIDLVDQILAPFVNSTLRTRLFLLATLLCALLLIARIVLDAFPNSGDEYAYILQAQIYAQGRLWADEPPIAQAFSLVQFLAKDGIWISMYQPGWAMLLAPEAWLGIPLWIVNPILAIALISAFFILSRREVSIQASWAATIALATSAFFVLNAASYFSHIATALWGVLFAIFALRYLETGDGRMAAIAGAFVGLLGITRVFNAAILICPFSIALALTQHRRAGLFWFGLGGAPFLGLYFAFYYAVTGDPLMTLPEWYDNSGEPVGAPTLISLQYLVVRFVHLVTWTSPLLALGFVAAFVSLARRGRLSFVDWIAPATVIAYAFYGGHGGNQYGPRYYFEAFPFAILTIARAFDGTLFAKDGMPRSALVASALIAHLAFQLGHLIPRLQLEHDVIVEREDLYRKVAAAKLSNAVVLIKSGTGKIQPMIARDLARNGMRIGEAAVVYAHDLGEQNQKTRALFPDRQFYQYEQGKLEPLN